MSALCSILFIYTINVGKQIELIQSGVKRINERLDSYGVRRNHELQNGLRLSHNDELCWRKVPRPEAIPMMTTMVNMLLDWKEIFRSCWKFLWAG